MARGRPPTGKQRQLPVSLSESQRTALEAASKKAGHSLAEEVRRRLDRTLYEDQFDAPTREFIEAVTDWSYSVARETGAPWHSHAGSHAVFRLTILKRLARLQPEGPTEFGDRPGRMIMSDDPDTIAGQIEYLDFCMWDTVRQESVRRAIEESNRELRERYEHGDKS
jgi:hypothetical protein